MILKWNMTVYFINKTKYKVFLEYFSLGRLAEPSTGTSDRTEVQKLRISQTTKRVLIQVNRLQNPDCNV